MKVSMKSHEKNTEFITTRSSPGYLLWLMCNKWQAQQRLALKPFDLTHVQFVLLACLVYAAEDGLTQVQLAERAEMDPMMTSQVLRKLEAKGFVQRLSNAADKRAVSVEVTNEGVELIERSMVAVEEVDKKFFSVIEKDMPVFVDMMYQLAIKPRIALNSKKEN
jgi:DNA-binding MarR family transcriptional regulator